LESALLRSADFYAKCGITLHTQTNVTGINPESKTVTTHERGTFTYDALLIATGAEPRRLDAPGAELGHVHYLRTLRDAQSLVDACVDSPDASAQNTKKRVVVIGASFIGLEAAAALRGRGLEVSVVSPAPLPMEKLLGQQLSDKLRAVHEQHGVTFHIGSTVKSIDPHHVHLVDGSSLPADVVVVGIGVAPRVELARAAGIAVREGILVNALLQTNFPDIYAAGDVAEWPDPFDGRPIRIEHWVVAERQGQAIAQSLLGNPKPFRQSPFFWSIQYDFGIGYIGHVREWDHTESDGDLEQKDWAITYFSKGAPRAMAIVSRNHQGLEMELMLETQMQKQSENS
jgi:NADPH-dependent 2,4-dienoyl-CoA reductase/sulfur reductase-like enzyme